MVQSVLYVRLPPKLFCSSVKITLAPVCPAASAALKPAGPLPTIKTSQCAWFFSYRSGSVPLGASPRPAARLIQYSYRIHQLAGHINVL